MLHYKELQKENLEILAVSTGNSILLPRQPTLNLEL